MKEEKAEKSSSGSTIMTWVAIFIIGLVFKVGYRLSVEDKASKNRYTYTPPTPSQKKPTEKRMDVVRKSIKDVPLKAEPSPKTKKVVDHAWLSGFIGPWKYDKLKSDSSKEQLALKLAPYRIIFVKGVWRIFLQNAKNLV